MATLELWHGSHSKGLETILPNANGLPKVFASSNIVVAVLFTAYPRKFSFMVDRDNKRVFTPNPNDLRSNDNGGSLYLVVGDFTPAPDKLIYEYEASTATVIRETEVVSAVSFIISIGYQIFADSALHQWAYFYQQEHGGIFPNQLPQHAIPISN